MLERKGIMRVCLILLTYLSTQIPNFCDTLAVSLLSRLSVTALSTLPPPHPPIRLPTLKKQSLQKVIVLSKVRAIPDQKPAQMKLT